MSLAVLLLFLLDDPLALHAELPDRPLEVGVVAELSIRYELGAGWTVPGNPLLPGGAPAAMIQLDAPPAVRFEGDEAETFQALLRNAFLDVPHERMITAEATTLRFEVLAELEPESAVELNLVLYAAPDAGKDRRPRLIRQRYRIPLRPGARARRIDVGAAAWGRHDVLALGDTAPGFELPTPFGEPLVLDELKGEGLVLLTTYRSCL